MSIFLVALQAWNASLTAEITGLEFSPLDLKLLHKSYTYTHVYAIATFSRPLSNDQTIDFKMLSSDSLERRRGLFAKRCSLTCSTTCRS